MSHLPRLDVERFRQITEPTVVLRRLNGTWLILGSSQDASVLGATDGLHLARRRGGGGAVLLGATEDLWIDLWIPSSSEWHRGDVRLQLEVVGQEFAAVLGTLSGQHLEMAKPRLPAEADESVCCFLGRGAGEVLIGESKLVGLAAWRSREGALVQSAMARRRTAALANHLDPAWLSEDIAARLMGEVAGLEDLGLAEVSGEDLAHALATHFRAASLSLHPELTD